MPVDLSALCQRINPDSATILLGSGATVPSGAPTVQDIKNALSSSISERPEDYNLSEYSGIFEKRTSRRELVRVLRQLIVPVKPNGGISNIANYNWHSIHTTNYDTVVEQCFADRRRNIRVFSSDYDFGGSTPPGTTCLYKFHGTIEKDIADGSNSRIIITLEDYEQLERYREKLYDQLRADINNSDLIIIGHSLADEDLKAIIRRSIKIRQDLRSPTSIYLLLYTVDEARAELYEDQGIKVCFGGIDDFFLELAKKASNRISVQTTSTDVLGNFPALPPTTYDVSKRAAQPPRKFSMIYSGAPCDYPDIRAGYAFERTATSQLFKKVESGTRVITILGSSGVGKTTLARQVALTALDAGWTVWEHKADRTLLADEWRSVAAELRKNGTSALLVLDDAHLYLTEINRLADYLSADQDSSLRLILTSARNHWKPRFKSTNLISRDHSLVFGLSQLDNAEITRLLRLTSEQPAIAQFVDWKFRGFSEQDKRRRLIERCSRDFFVCLKNIFDSEAFDLIVLREYASAAEDVRNIYKYVCAMETLGVVVHRQAIVRILNVPAQDIGRILEHLEGLVEEYDIDLKRGVYGWRGRHHVISEIVSKNRFSDQRDILDLLRKVVSNISPTYDVEIRTLRQLCSPEMGIRSISDLDDQNELLRTLISTAPMERLPRHRLILNLIQQGDFSGADTEIKVYVNDLGLDRPVRRYKVKLTLEKAIRADGLLPEDRAAMLTKAYEGAKNLLTRSQQDYASLKLFGDVGLEIFRATGSYSAFDEALDAMKIAEAAVNDPDVTALIRRFQRKIAPISGKSFEFRLEEYTATEDSTEDDVVDE